MEYKLFGNKSGGQQTLAALRVVQFSLVFSLLLTPKLWLPIDRVLPAIPAFYFVDMLPSFLNFGATILAIIILLFSFFAKHKKFLFLSYLILISIASIFDVLRVQPWLFYYSAFIFVLYFTQSDPKKALHICAFILSLVYIFSGMQKLNAGFATDTFPWLMQPITNHTNKVITRFISSLWILAPIAEFGAGLGLWFKRSQKTSKWILVGMHLFILMMIGPAGLNVNVVVWPWNISFIVLLLILFDSSTEFSIQFYKKWKPEIAKYATLLVFVLLPVLSFSGFWPKHLSAALYSGNKVRGYVYLSDQITASLPIKVQAKSNKFDNRLSVTNWAMGELNVAMYPADWAQIRLFKSLCSTYYNNSQLFVFKLYEEPSFKTGLRKEVNYFCDDFF